MTPDEAKASILVMIKGIESCGYYVSLESDYGGDNRIEICPKEWTSWQDVREIRWRDWND